MKSARGDDGGIIGLRKEGFNESSAAKAKQKVEFSKPKRRK